MGGAGAVGSRWAGAGASSAGAGAERGARPRRSHLGPHGGKGHRPYRPSDEEAAEGQRTGAGRRPQGGGGILAPPRRQKGAARATHFRQGQGGGRRSGSRGEDRKSTSLNSSN